MQTVLHLMGFDRIGLKVDLRPEAIPLIKSDEPNQTEAPAVKKPKKSRDVEVRFAEQLIEQHEYNKDSPVMKKPNPVQNKPEIVIDCSDLSSVSEQEDIVI